MSQAERLEPIDEKILYYIHKSGPVFFMKLAKRLNEDAEMIRDRIKGLQERDFLERVTGTMVNYRVNKRGKVTKHRNHTYYNLTRKARLYIREHEVAHDINLRAPYKQA